VNGAKLGFGQTLDVNVLVTGSAQVGGYFMSFGAATLDLANANSQFVIEIAGAEGSRELSFSSGAALADITTAINTFTAVTGVKASVSGTGIRMESSEFGSDEFVSVKVADDGGIGAASAIGVYDFLTANALGADPNSGGASTPLTTYGSVTAQNGVTDFGLDVQATVNGIIATSEGTKLSINTDFLDVEIDLVYDTASADANASKLGLVSAFEITGGGADFMLAPRVDIGGKVSLGIQDVAVRNVGRSSVDNAGTLSTYHLSDLATGRGLNLVDGNLEGAQKVVGRAIEELGALRGRLGAFQRNTIGATIRSLGVSLENTTAAESVIRDADFASETSELTRNQILVQSATNVLGLSNSQPQAVLQLLG
jgi:flagellin